MVVASTQGMSHAISQYMTEAPVTIDRHATLATAHELMRELDIRHLPVLEDGKLVGIVSRGDLHLIETVADFSLEDVEVEEAMTADPYVVGLDAPVGDVLDAMVTHKYGCAIVVAEDGTIAGLFTTHDAMKVLASCMRASVSGPGGVGAPRGR